MLIQNTQQWVRGTLTTLLTATGRKELLFFLSFYGLSEFLVLFIDSAVAPTYSGSYLVRMPLW